MGLNFAADNPPELLTTSISVWSPICDFTLNNNNETYSAKFVMTARKQDGTSATWDAIYVFDRTSSTNRVLTPNLLNVLTPVKDLGALNWDIRVIVSGTSFQVQCKGGTTLDPVGWFISGNVNGLQY